MPVDDDLDLTFTAKERAEAKAAPRRQERVYTNERQPKIGVALIITVLMFAVLAGTYSCGRATARNKYESIAEEALAEVAYAVDTAAQARDAADYWKAVSEEQSRTIDALASEVESATAALGRLSIQIHETQELNRALKSEIEKKAVTPQSRTRTTNPETPIKTSADAWNHEQVASTLTAAAKSYGLTAEQTAWVVETGCRVAYRESTYRPDARNGQYLGLFQFGDAWGSVSERLDGVWSCYRFVRVYRDGGEAAIYRHWKATV